MNDPVKFGSKLWWAQTAIYFGLVFPLLWVDTHFFGHSTTKYFVFLFASICACLYISRKIVKEIRNGPRR